MHWKKYVLLLPPFVLIGVLMLTYLPPEQTPYTILAVVAFWLCYYMWVFIDKKRNRHK
ncbi:hypothetical protein [Gracilibacillus oryzae]|uniref:hypothetical protein n=1 Tax=Gracilibacillus oryzae TaxID=1672701 RepID=UPI0012966EA5|nr:hypothetical protein [Gracilibacillus oryzae]